MSEVKADKGKSQSIPVVKRINKIIDSVWIFDKRWEHIIAMVGVNADYLLTYPNYTISRFFDKMAKMVKNKLDRIITEKYSKNLDIEANIENVLEELTDFTAFNDEYSTFYSIELLWVQYRFDNKSDTREILVDSFEEYYRELISENKIIQMPDLSVLYMNPDWKNIFDELWAPMSYKIEVNIGILNMCPHLTKPNFIRYSSYKVRDEMNDIIHKNYAALIDDDEGNPIFNVNMLVKTIATDFELFIYPPTSFEDRLLGTGFYWVDHNYETCTLTEFVNKYYELVVTKYMETAWYKIE
jgi:hypothetical protein